MANQVPSPGRVVNYVVPDGTIRPAMVVRVWTITCVTLGVFTDPLNDAENFPETAHVHPPAGVVSRPSVDLDETGRRANSWHWPLYVTPIKAEKLTVEEFTKAPDPDAIKLAADVEVKP